MHYDPIQANRPLLREIADFCTRTGISQTRFGEEALNDKALVTNLKAGRQLLPGTLFKVRAYMAGSAEAAE